MLGSINTMEIQSIKDIKLVRDIMHDSEFTEEDFDFDCEQKFFRIKSHSPDTGENFSLELHNVKTYDPQNLDKIRKGKATGGVFNTIKIKRKGLKLIILSQDLHIVLTLDKIEGQLIINK